MHTYNKVLVRVRPFLEAETLRQAQNVVECSSGSRSADPKDPQKRQKDPYVSIRAHPRRGIRCKYVKSLFFLCVLLRRPKNLCSVSQSRIRYDYVYGPDATQPQVYAQVQACVKRVLDGNYSPHVFFPEEIIVQFVRHYT